MTERDWKKNPPQTPEEGLDLMFHLNKLAMENANRKYGFGGRVERRGNLLVNIWPDGTEDVYEIGAEFMQ